MTKEFRHFERSDFATCHPQVLLDVPSFGTVCHKEVRKGAFLTHKPSDNTVEPI